MSMSVSALKNKIIQTLRVLPWKLANGDNTYRINYPELNENSVVIDLGGYRGDWAQQINDKYNCAVYVFEPVISYYNIITERFKGNDKVKAFAYGLASSHAEVNIAINEEASSIYDEVNLAGAHEKIVLKPFHEFINEHNIHQIDLLKINIEGAEYELMDYMIEKDLLKLVKNLQIQFHDFLLGDSDARVKKIQEYLKKTHHVTYQFHYVWENWKLN